jgi:DNA helicase HerA-like ATPase
MILQLIKERMRTVGWSAEKGIKLFVVLDEAWKIAKDPRSDAITIVREGRKYQFSLIVATQNPTDVNEAIFSNVGTMFIMRLQFRQFKDYIRSSLSYSDFIAQGIDRFGVGEAAVHLVFSESTRFPSTFLLDRVDGEEPLVVVKLDFSELNREDMEFHLDELKRKLLSLGLSDGQLKKLVSMMTEGKKNKLSVLTLVQALDEFGYARALVINFLREIGVGEQEISKIFMRV